MKRRKKQNIPADFEYIGEGNTRIVYKHKNFVIKIPINDDGLHDNFMEAKISKKYKREPDQNGISFARCKQLVNGWLVMEFVDTEVEIKDLPQWAFYIDCWQVGYTSKKKLVAYDYA